MIHGKAAGQNANLTDVGKAWCGCARDRPGGVRRIIGGSKASEFCFMSIVLQLKKGEKNREKKTYVLGCLLLCSMSLFSRTIM